MYEKEVVEQGQKVDKMKADNKDEYDIKKQVCKSVNNSFICMTILIITVL